VTYIDGAVPAGAADLAGPASPGPLSTPA
jgi:hypothetical protein